MKLTGFFGALGFTLLCLTNTDKFYRSMDGMIKEMVRSRPRPPLGSGRSLLTCPPADPRRPTQKSKIALEKEATARIKGATE